MQTMITSMILQNRSGEDASIQQAIADYLKISGVGIFTPQQIRIFRTAERDRILIRFSYTEPMRLPYLDIGFDREMEIIVEEVLR